MMKKLIPRSFLVATVAVITVLLVSYVALRHRWAPPSPVLGTKINGKALSSLKARAAAGDAEAQYGLTLFVGTSAEAEALMEQAARGGYPPAMVMYADTLMNDHESRGNEARAMLENAAMRGNASAISALADCLENGRCGGASVKGAFTWLVVLRKLGGVGPAEQAVTQKNEDRLRSVLLPDDVSAGEREAEAIVSRISRSKHKPQSAVVP